MGGERIRYPSIGSPSEIGLIRGEEEQPKGAIVDDCLFVAVGKEVKESRSTVIWALQNSGGKKIWILHVHICELPPLLVISFLAFAPMLALVDYDECQCWIC